MDTPAPEGGPPPFPLGQTVATPAALAALEAAGVSPRTLLARHARADWGNIGEEDRQLNALALINGDRLLSAYALPTGQQIWVITEADRSATTVLFLPDEY